VVLALHRFREAPAQSCLQVQTPDSTSTWVVTLQHLLHAQVWELGVCPLLPICSCSGSMQSYPLTVYIFPGTVWGALLPLCSPGLPVCLADIATMFSSVAGHWIWGTWGSEHAT
jgi:hypothetical protein